MYSEAMLDGITARFKALAEPMRIRVLHALRGGEQTVSGLMGTVGANQANLSKHLGVLHREGLVSRRKDGLHVYYRIADSTVFRICDVVCGSLEARAARQAKALRPGARSRRAG